MFRYLWLLWLALAATVCLPPVVERIEALPHQLSLRHVAAGVVGLLLLLLLIASASTAAEALLTAVEAEAMRRQQGLSAAAQRRRRLVLPIILR